MAYSTVNEVKEILHITDDAKDAEIAGCIADADGWIDNELGEYTAVPLSSTPSMINIASKYKAAALFRERQESEQETSEWKRFDARAEKTLTSYIRKTYFMGSIR